MTDIKKKPQLVAPVYLPQKESFARISLRFRDPHEAQLDENEFKFLLATAIQTIHGEFANQVDVLDFKEKADNYFAIIRFKSVHHARVLTSLILFGEWKGLDCRFDVHRVASSPCILTCV